MTSPASDDGPRKRSPWRWALDSVRVLLGVGIVYWILTDAEVLAAAGELLRRPGLYVLVALIPILDGFVEAARIKLLFGAQGFRLSGSYAYRLVAIGTLFAFVVPGGTGGDAVKLYYIGVHNRGRAVEVATTLLTDRVLSLVSFILTTLMIGGLAIGHLWQHQALRFFYLAVVALAATSLVAMTLFVSPPVRDSRVARGLLALLERREMLGRIARSMSVFSRNPGVLWRVCLLGIAGHLALLLMVVVIGSVVFPTTLHVVVAFLSQLGLLANTLPLTPGGLGVGEAAFEQLFGLVGLGGGAALMLAVRTAMLPFAGLGALFYAGGLKQVRASSHSRIPVPEDVHP